MAAEMSFTPIGARVGEGILEVRGHFCVVDSITESDRSRREYEWQRRPPWCPIHTSGTCKVRLGFLHLPQLNSWRRSEETCKANLGLHLM